MLSSVWFARVELSSIILTVTINSMVTSSDMCAKSSGGDSGGGGDEHKMCTSYEQNVEHCKKDGASDVDDIADGIGKVDVSDKEAVISSTINQAEVAQKGDQNQRAFTDYGQDEISSIYSKQRDHTMILCLKVWNCLIQK